MLLHNGLTSAVCLAGGLWASQGLGDPVQTVLPASQQIVAFLCGAASWTLVEYVVHRWVFHLLVPASHAKHHLLPREARYLHGPTHVVLGTWVSALLLYVGGLGPALGLLAVAGLNVTFLGFELLHAHVHRDGGHWLLRRARTWHALHHRNDAAAGPPAGFGFVSPFWDLLFGTWPDRAPLPRWLVWVTPIPLPLLHFVLAALLARGKQSAPA